MKILEAETILQEIRSMKVEDSLDYYTNLSNRLDRIAKLIENCTTASESDNMIDQVKHTIHELMSEPVSTNNILFYYSILINAPFHIDNDHTIQALIQYIQSTDMDIDTQLFLYRYISHTLFIYNDLQTIENQIAVWNFFTDLMHTYRQSLPVLDELQPIPTEKRNSDLYIVICSQFLSEEHGPTKTTLDRCKTIINKMNKKVLLINCAECLSPASGILLYHSFYGNYSPDLSQSELVNWKNTSIPFFQCDQNMPDKETITMLLRTIHNMAPAMIIDISGSSVLANMCNYFIPTLAISLCPSMFAPTTEAFQAFGQKLTNEEYRILEGTKYPVNQVIESVFTSGLIEQQQHLTKESLGIQDDRFNIAVIGCRLHDEVTNDFVSMINSTSAENICFNFCGVFNEYQSFIESHPGLDKHCRFLGFQKDILAVLDLMDLYVSPKRRGGGTSCVESLSKGIPAVTVRFGDVYANSGEDFAVDNYSDMVNAINKYRDEPQFYEDQSVLARKRAAILLDTDSEFTRILDLCMSNTK